MADLYLYEPRCGQHFSQAAEKSLEISKALGTLVYFHFNGTEVVVDHTKDTLKHIHNQFNSKREAARAEYENSAEYKAYKIARDAEVASNNIKIAAMVDDLPNVLKAGEASTMNWLKDYTVLADDSSVDGKFDKVIEFLTKAGYSEKDSSYDRETTKVTANVMARYIAGNALSCMKDGMPPHPVLEKFVGQYFELQAQEQTRSLDIK